MSEYNLTTLTLTPLSSDTLMTAPSIIDVLKKTVSFTLDEGLPILKLEYINNSWSQDNINSPDNDLANIIKTHPSIRVFGKITIDETLLDTTIDFLSTTKEYQETTVIFTFSSELYNAIHKYNLTKNNINAKLKENLIHLFINIAIAVNADGFVFDFLSGDPIEPTSESILLRFGQFIPPYSVDGLIIGLSSTFTDNSILSARKSMGLWKHYQQYVVLDYINNES